MYHIKYTIILFVIQCPREGAEAKNTVKLYSKDTISQRGSGHCGLAISKKFRPSGRQGSLLLLAKLLKRAGNKTPLVSQTAKI